MRIVIVDDEPRHRKGLANLISKMRPDYYIEQLKNGSEALEFVKNNNAEIIITDVEMPTMDGLEFLKKYKEIEHSCRVIILSGYPNFEYAQKAINLGAFDYVLKPVDEDIIENMLVKVEKSIDEEKENKKKEMELLDSLNNTIEVYLEWEFNRWIKGELNKGKFEGIKKYINENEKGWIIVTRISGCDHVDENEEILVEIKSIITEMVMPYGRSISFYLNDHDKILVTVIRKSKMECNLTNLFSWNEAIKFIKEKYNKNITIGVSSKSENIIYEGKKLFNEAIEALSLKFYFKEGDVLRFSDENRIKKSNILINSKYEERLRDSVYKDDRVGAITLLDEILFKAMKDGYLDPKEIKSNVERLFINLIKEVESFMSDNNFNEIIANVTEVIDSSENVEELKRNCNVLIIKITSVFKRWKNDKNTIIFDKYLKYIEENYMIDISLENISEKFHFNPCYFSTMFKERVGTTFVKYLLKLRIQKACELLLESDKKVYEIAALVGYKEAKYFNRVFKNEMNVSPDEYRRMNSAEINKRMVL